MSSGYAASETVLNSVARTQAQKSLETHCFVHSSDLDFFHQATFVFACARLENIFARNSFNRTGIEIEQHR